MIHVICALHVEAAPLIKRFDLKQRAGKFSGHFYFNDVMTLTLSGVGKTSAAAAVMATLYEFPEAFFRQWLNVGVAGHKTLDLGMRCVANKVVDAGSGQTWYPQFVFDANAFSQAMLMTCDSVVHQYPADTLVDMEASGFCSQAMRWSTAEHVHCFKVVSDNQRAPVNKNKQGALLTDLIARACDDIETFVSSLCAMSQEGAAKQFEQVVCAFLHRWRFSHYETLELRKQIAAWQAVIGRSASVDQFAKLQTAQEVLQVFKEEIRDFPLDYGAE